jgi:hypothetical protein
MKFRLVIVSWGGRIRTYAWRDQNPLPYRLATPQCVMFLLPLVEEVIRTTTEWS